MASGLLASIGSTPFRIRFVESAVNQVIAKRMEKKQQMQWTPKGAHLLIQVRKKVLNQEWKGIIDQWYSQSDQEDKIPMVA